MAGDNKKGTINFSLSIQEIYKVLCPECKAKVEEMVKEQLTSAIVKKTLEIEE